MKSFSLFLVLVFLAWLPGLFFQQFQVFSVIVMVLLAVWHLHSWAMDRGL